MDSSELPDAQLQMVVHQKISKHLIPLYIVITVNIFAFVKNALFACDVVLSIFSP